ncbi:magnesium transporter CorA family protein [Prolixibacter sp. NT017]|uniref:magnesium transporter CorA family protein n=1 Tax=Prolixibacter sp. NT017 TaxID=2652390 RepID=UPI00126BB473|nr:magnesium transporter CorA family protein [Prolixibacter sp. NT017]GET25435.1 Mg2+/Co2+ transporter [Prolixibacter sp. NT017]
MIKIFRSFGGYVELPQAEKGCWINVTNPTPDEITALRDQYNMPDDIVKDILDQDERPRLENDDDWSLVILRIPIENQNNGVPFHTVPLGVFMTQDVTITLCSVQNEVLPSHQPSLYREPYQQVNDELNFILKLFLRSATTYLRYLKYINQQTSLIETDLEKSIRNKELTKLLKMEKCLVFFITSLRSNEIVLTKLRNSRRNTLTEINEDLLEDAVIENKQAIDMAQIYSDIQSGMMDAFASVISNNLNVVMKQLTSISIILMIPTLIASLYGMNVPNFMENSAWAFPAILFFSGLAAYIGIVMFRKRKWF